VSKVIYLRSLISMILDWVSFLAYPNLFGIKGFVVVVHTFVSVSLCYVSFFFTLLLAKAKRKKKLSSGLIVKMNKNMPLHSQ
jgi:hypothetical protein